MTELEYAYWSEAVVCSVAERIYVSAELVIHVQSVFYDVGYAYRTAVIHTPVFVATAVKHGYSFRVLYCFQMVFATF